MTGEHTRHVRLAAEVVELGGTTLAEQARIRLKDKPAPLFQLACLVVLAAKPIAAAMAADAAYEVRRAGMTTPTRLLESTWQQRVDALGRAHYRRYDESSSTRLAEAAVHVRDSWHGDLRRLAAAADGDVSRAETLLEDVPGIGPTGAQMFLREVQQVWSWVAPYIDDRGRAGAKSIGLPTEVAALRRLAREVGPGRFAAGLVRVSLDDTLRDTLLGT